MLALSCAFFLSAQTQLVTKNRSLPAVNKTFYVIAHIVKDSLGKFPDTNEVKTKIRGVSPYFAPIGINFDVCRVNIIPNYALNDLKDAKEYREMLNTYHVDNRINMFFVNSYDQFGEGFGFAESKGVQNVEDGGILFPNSFSPLLLQPNPSLCMAHTIGHYFGLAHTFDGGNEVVNRTNCNTEGDKLCDTQADPYIIGTPFTNYIDDKCSFTDKSKDSEGQYYIPDVGNIMSYYSPCFCSFTSDQLQLMAESYLNALKKMW